MKGPKNQSNFLVWNDSRWIADNWKVGPILIFYYLPCNSKDCMMVDSNCH